MVRKIRFGGDQALSEMIPLLIAEWIGERIGDKTRTEKHSVKSAHQIWLINLSQTYSWLESCANTAIGFGEALPSAIIGDECSTEKLFIAH